MKIAVVGGGIIGSCCAWRLAERKHQVTIFDPRSLGHPLGSSHGRSRIVRRTYPDPFYTAIMSEAYPMWAEVEQKTGNKLLHECGLLLFGPEDAPMIADAEASMAGEGVPFQRVGPEGQAPGPKLVKGDRGLFVPEGGWVAADRAHAAIRRLAYHHGAQIVNREVTPDDLTSFNRIVVAPGPWIKQWVPDLDVEVTLQTFAYALTKMPVGGPVWIHAVDQLFYGFPSESGQSSVKIGVHVPGPEVEADAVAAPTPQHLSWIYREAHDRFPSLDRNLDGHRCLYTTTPDEDFRIGQIDDRRWFVSACSGHAFKMAPWIGNLMADLVEERQDLDDWPRFRWPRV